MRFCPNCQREYEDNLKFCKDCGTELVEKDFKCPNCGASIDANDTFCGNCGHQISAKKEKKTSINIGRILSYASIFVLVSFIILASLCFIGSFGTVLKKTDTLTSAYTGSPASVSLGLDFYSTMFKDANTANQNGYHSFATILRSTTLVQLLFLVLVFFAVIFGIVFSAICLSRASKNKDNFYKVFKHKILYIFPLCALPHPVMMLTTYCGKINVEGTNFQMNEGLGWGSGMIFVCCIIALVLLLLYGFLKRLMLQIEKRGTLDGGYLASEIVQICLNIAFIIVLFLSAKRSVFVNYQQSGFTMKGYGGTMSDYMASLLDHEMNGTNMPETSLLMYFGYFFLQLGFAMSIPFIIFMDDKKVLKTTIFAILLFVVSVLAFTFSWLGESGYIEEVADGLNGAVHYSALGIVLYVLIFAIPFVVLIKNAKLEAVNNPNQ